MKVVFNTSKIQFKSNSQLAAGGNLEAVSCVQYLKDTIQKQFTTHPPAKPLPAWLCSIPQRYNSKAIHNIVRIIIFNARVVFNTSKIQFKSNSQPRAKRKSGMRRCVQYLKDTIQKQFTTYRATSVGSVLLCSIPQRYNSKAIHNSCECPAYFVDVVFNTSKIQFKSNSQLKTNITR